MIGTVWGADTWADVWAADSWANVAATAPDRGAIGTYSIGARSIGASRARAPTVLYAKPSGAIGTHAIGAGFGIGGGTAAAAASSSDTEHLVRWRRRGRR